MKHQQWHSINILKRAVCITALLIPQICLSDTPQPNIIEKIEQDTNGEVSIDIPQNIINLLTRKGKTVKKVTSDTPNLRTGVNKLSGFRIQVFGDGRNPSTLEARARARGNAILSRFPQYRGQVYTYSSSPNWYTRVGNFRTNAEASAALTEIKRAFPNFAPEMRIVKCQIVLIKE